MIGLKRGTVKLVAYDAGWIALFDEERVRLLAMFGERILSIEHVGSTAIPEMPAKPILDLAIGVDTLITAQRMQAEFARLGYEYRPSAADEPPREVLYVKGSEEQRTHYAHVMVYGDVPWQAMVQFRDCLRQDAALAAEYASLKQELAGQYAQDRASYTRSKTTFISRVLQQGKIT